MLDPQQKQALRVLRIRIGQMLEKDEYNLKDLEDILVCLTSLISVDPFTTKFLKWLGKFCEMEEILKTAEKYWGARTGLKTFARIVRGL